ncbi:M56 family metallopeptidase [Anaerostipes sp.]|uniref:M56 family metallopeptidase n=1 Tax=Anaerostipes sp. TaxID=1872530 RepID=UPI0025C3B7D7|nr:M56 family metallopeptidase [Anaerostipes sp.]MBS7007282.1 M56 family metallopeptidase [Anaerostipes sp.]
MLGPSYGSVLTCCAFSSLLMIFIWVASRNPKFILRNGTSILFVSILLIILRLFVPFNFIFSWDIYSEKIVPTLLTVFYWKIFSIILMDYLIAVFVIVAVIRLLIYFHRLSAFRKLKKISSPLSDHNINQLLVDILQEHGCKKHIPIYCIPSIGTPAIAGLIHPIIILPETDYSYEQLQFILEHELQHYLHHDLWLKFFCEIMVCLYWWNPLSYIIRRQLKNVLEYDNDLQITKSMPEHQRLDYAQTLLNTAAPKKVPNGLPTMHFREAEPTCMEMRLCLLMNRESADHRKISQWIYIGFVLIILLLSVCFIIEPRSIPSEVEETTFEEPTKKNTFFIKRSDQQGYDMYVNNKLCGRLDGLELFQGYKVYKTKKEALHYEKIK